MKDLIEKYDIQVAPFLPIKPLSEILEYLKTVTGIEGYVIAFENGELKKCKSTEYCYLHQLLTDDIAHEHKIIEFVINDTLDDVLPQIPLNDPRRVYVMKIRDHVVMTVNEVKKQISDDFTRFWTPKKTRKDIAIQFNKHTYFGIIMKMYSIVDEKHRNKVDPYYDPDWIVPLLGNTILKQCNRLENAKTWLVESKFDLDIKYQGMSG